MVLSVFSKVKSGAFRARTVVIRESTTLFGFLRGYDPLLKILFFSTGPCWPIQTKNLGESFQFERNIHVRVIAIILQTIAAIGDIPQRPYIRDGSTSAILLTPRPRKALTLNGTHIL